MLTRTTIALLPPALKVKITRSNRYEEKSYEKTEMYGFGYLCLCVMPLVAVAGDFNGSKPLLCAVVETYECGPGGDCQ